MGSGTWRLTVRQEFSASHRLRNQGGKCEALHGHNFGVEVEVEGDATDPATGMLMDFAHLKRETREVLEELDHSHLNDLPAFANDNPSSEHISRHIYRRLKERVAACGVRMVRVTVAEKAAQSATYMED